MVIIIHKLPVGSFNFVQCLSGTELLNLNGTPYILQVLVPDISNLREKPEFANKTTVLLMDSACPHVSEGVLQLLGRNKIMAIVCPAHTTNIFHALDLVFFCVLKKIKQTATVAFDGQFVREQITKLIQIHEQTATSMTVRASFRKAGV
jgi:hypothetical protein